LLNGKSPNDAAADFHLRLRVEALILRLEMDDLQNLVGFEFNELRRKLDLPERGPLDPTQMEVLRLPMIRVHRLEASKLTDDQLLLLFHRAQTLAAIRAIRQLGSEVVARESLNAKLDKNSVFRLLVQVSANSEGAAELVQQAKRHAQSRGESPAQWLLVEMNLCIQRGDVNQVQQIMHTLQTKHLREPGVAEAVYQFLMAIGAIGPDGQPVGPAMEAAGSPAASGGVWTPGSSAPASEGKSKLWVPGMD
jgi:hypothetical protein